MHLVGDGVTRNFLTILEQETRRSVKSLFQVALVASLVFLLAWVALHRYAAWALATVPAAFVAAFGLGLIYTNHFVIGAYEVSLRDHWNRWMRWSASCRTVRECYAKVHNGRLGPSWWVGGLLLTTVLLAHLVVGLLALNGTAGLARTLPLYVFDVSLLGFFAGRQILERRWYRRFLRSCNDLLADGALGVWGVY